MDFYAGFDEQGQLQWLSYLTEKIKAMESEIPGLLPPAYLLGSGETYYELQRLLNSQKDLVTKQ
jgi:hypothetical protein